jgi:pyrimidine operon attenuation protein/uracil phosphoribosyltransferase
MNSPKQAPTSKQTAEALQGLVAQVAAFSEKKAVRLVAVANGGIPVARMLASRLPALGAVGIINAAFHRDDIGLQPIPKSFQPTDLPFSIDEADVLLVDDVFATGRTLRASLNELFDQGRPASVRFAVLVDTENRLLPFRPDFTGLSLPTPPDQKVVVSSHPGASPNEDLLRIHLCPTTP